MVPIDHFDTAAERQPEALAIVDGNVRMTFAEVSAVTHRVARFLANGDRGASFPFPVVVYSPNDYRVLLAKIAIMRAGGIIVPVHAGNPVDVTRQFLLNLRPRYGFYHTAVREQVELLQNTKLETKWFCLDGSDAELFAPSAVQPYAATWIDASGNRDRPVYYWATSGTTGEPKVVIDDVGTFEGALLLVREWNGGERNRPVTLAVAPLSHGAGPHSFAVLTLGGTVVVMRNFEPAAMLDAIEEYGVTDMWLPPTALYLLLERPDIRRRNVRSLRHVRLGTAAVAATRIKEAVSVLGPCISQTYGQIESGFVTALDSETTAEAAHGRRPELLMSAGRSLFVNRVAIMSAFGRLLPAMEEGEIVVRGRCVKRYLDVEATTEARVFGWHHTGDIGYFDREGFLFIVGRKRDVVNMAGIKIPASELEGVILELEAIRECAVIAVPDEIRGEVARAILSIKGGYSMSVDTVLAHCRQRVGAHRAPVAAEHWPELPKSPAGKIDKAQIRRVVMRRHHE
jgi:fatty-acyl-CoA synthase